MRSKAIAMNLRSSMTYEKDVIKIRENFHFAIGAKYEILKFLEP